MKRFFFFSILLSGSLKMAAQWSTVTGANTNTYYNLSGNVGIGTGSTTVPSSKLIVAGLGGATIDFLTSGRARISGTSPGLSIHDLTNERSFIGWAGSGIPSQALGIYTPTGGWNTFNPYRQSSATVPTISGCVIFTINEYYK